MKAALINRYGPPSVFEMTDVPQPKPKKNQVLVRVHASSVNPVDWKMRSGSISFLSGGKFPKIPGADFAGTIIACGRDVSAFKTGDEVFGFNSAIWEAGAYAEYVCCDISNIALMPANLDFLSAACIPLAASTAFQALYQQGKMKPGKDVLIAGATGGVGHFAVQIAKAAGCRVTGVCHSSNQDLAMKLGCDRVLPYDTQPFTLDKERYHLIFDATGKYGYFDCRPRLKPNGIMVSTLPLFSIMLMHAASILSPWRKGKFVPVAAKTADLKSLADLCEAEKLKPHVDHVFPLEKMAEAHALSETEKVRGKIAIRIA